MKIFGQNVLITLDLSLYHVTTHVSEYHHVKCTSDNLEILDVQDHLKTNKKETC